MKVVSSVKNLSVACERLMLVLALSGDPARDVQCAWLALCTVYCILFATVMQPMPCASITFTAGMRAPLDAHCHATTRYTLCELRPYVTACTVAVCDFWWVHPLVTTYPNRILLTGVTSLKQCARELFGHKCLPIIGRQSLPVKNSV